VNARNLGDPVAEADELRAIAIECESRHRKVIGWPAYREDPLRYLRVDYSDWPTGPRR
jgi:hypothetical protein